jgi:hypothetical protein
VLVSAGGILTITYDYRETTIAFLRSRLGGQTGPVSHSSPPSTTFLPTSASIELQERNPKDTLGVSPNASLDVAEVAQPSSSAGLRQRRSHPIFVDEALDEEPLVIMTPNPIVAAVVGTLMVILVVSVIVVRARLASPPRALDFFANMLIAGVIIFGVSGSFLSINLSNLTDRRVGWSGRHPTSPWVHCRQWLGLFP